MKWFLESCVIEYLLSIKFVVLLGTAVNGCSFMLFPCMMFGLEFCVSWYLYPSSLPFFSNNIFLTNFTSVCKQQSFNYRFFLSLFTCRNQCKKFTGISFFRHFEITRSCPNKGQTFSPPLTKYCQQKFLPLVNCLFMHHHLLCLVLVFDSFGNLYWLW